MSTYITEEEQLANIKKWWGKYGTAVLLVLSLLLASTAGYRFWHWHEDNLTTQASNAYEHLMIAFSNQDNRQVEAYANQLTNEYSQTVYADAGQLIMAKLFIADEQYKKALDALKYVAANTKMASLAQVAKLRIVRLLIEQKEYNKALAELSAITTTTYTPVVNELKGDIYTATENYQEALRSYKKAIEETNAKGIGNLFLEMKTNEIMGRVNLSARDQQ
jgi:predicted negative regulator of RcsB-dependent stress response